MATLDDKNSGNLIKTLFVKIKTDFINVKKITKQIVKDDPRRIVHCIKYGLTIALVSLFYYFYEGFGVGAMWAVLTVQFVFEYSVGGTIGKFLNRIVATIIGVWLAVGAQRLSRYSPDDLKPFLIGFFLFTIATIGTFMRYYPKIKAKFDYGMVIFILTFSLMCVSGYLDDHVIHMAKKRMITILIGCFFTVAICVVICPVWAGNDLHNLTASNIEKLGNFLEEFGVEYVAISKDAAVTDMTISFQNILDSKYNVDSLRNFARWEPRHGGFKHRHPWSQYQKICTLTRDYACLAEALRNVLYSRTQPASKEVKAKFLEPCLKMSIESGKAMKELSLTIKDMRQSCNAISHIQNAKQAAQDLNLILRSNYITENIRLSDITQSTTVASLLTNIVLCTEEIAEAVQRLATLAKFKSIIVDNKVAPETVSMESRSSDTYVITIEGSSPSSTTTTTTTTTRSSVSEESPSINTA